MKMKVVLTTLAAVALTALAYVQQNSATFTASTNATLTTSGTLSADGGADFGTLRRVVITLSPGLTNLDVALVDGDGTTLFTTNSVSSSFTASFDFGVVPYVGCTVQSANAQAATTNALTFTVQWLRDR